MDILFYDPVSKSPYSSETLQTEAMGGTEATIVRIAEGLASHHQIFVTQQCRHHDQQQANVQYISFATALTLRQQHSFDVVILLRDVNFLVDTAKQFPNAKLFFWMHNTPPKNLSSFTKALTRYQIIAVSNFHKHAIEKRLHPKWYQRLICKSSSIKINVIYNPIADDLMPDGTVYQANKLIFSSSPQKGLKQTLDLFQQVLKHFPDYELFIANPGHREMDFVYPKQTTILGKLPHHAIIQQLRESFCVFYPQHIKSETFGLIYAEANAVGTPVLAHDIGAAREVLSETNPLVDGRNIDAIVQQLKKWQQSRPKVQAKEQFRLRNVIVEWLKLMGS